jgi:hypothetical protein
MEASALRRRIEVARAKLLSARSKRPRPFRDEKIITAWNGLMISTLAYGAIVLNERSYAEAAARAADFVLKQSRKNGRLTRFFHEEPADVGGYLDDYAFLLLGLTDLYEATFDVRWLRESSGLAEEMLALFRDPKTGTLRYSARDQKNLIAPPDSFYDGAEPSAQSVAALALLRLGRLTMNAALETHGGALIAAASAGISRSPLGYTQMLMAVDFAIGPVKEIVIAGPRSAEGTATLLDVVGRTYVPRAVRLLNQPGDASLVVLVPFLTKQGMLNDKPTAYVCENYVCDLPTNDPAKLEELLRTRSPRTPKAATAARGITPG